MVLDETLKVDVGDAVAVRQEERPVSEPGPEPTNATAGVRFQAGVDEVDGPGVSLRLVALHRPAAELNGHVSVERQVIHEETLDVVGLVAQRDGEFAEPVLRVVLHDMP